MAGNSKNFLSPVKIIDAGDMSQASITSSVTDIRYLDNVSIQCIFTGTPTGSFALEGSLDYYKINGAVQNTGTWTPITLSSTPAASGSAGNILLDLNQLSFPYIRVVYTKLSGTGTLNVYISGKAV